MSASASPLRLVPKPGAPVPRTGKPYIWVTWLAGLLGGKQCLWAAWFRAHFNFVKVEEEGPQLAQWNREHTAFVNRLARDLVDNGWHVALENENSFQLEGQVAILAGKPDIVATMPGHALALDGKTGQVRDSDWWQVLLYLLALGYTRHDLKGAIVGGQVEYTRASSVKVWPIDLTPERTETIIELIKTVGGATPPKKVPSQYECLKCNIGEADCPERYRAGATTVVKEF